MDQNCTCKILLLQLLGDILFLLGDSHLYYFYKWLVLMGKLFIPSLLFECNYVLNLGFLGIHENDGPQWLASLVGLVP